MKPLASTFLFLLFTTGLLSSESFTHFGCRLQFAAPRHFGGRTPRHFGGRTPRHFCGQTPRHFGEQIYRRRHSAWPQRQRGHRESKHALSYSFSPATNSNGNSNNSNSNSNNNSSNNGNVNGNGNSNGSKKNNSPVAPLYSTPRSNSELESLKLRESELRSLLATVTSAKRSILQKRPLSIAIIGFGRFGQFIAERFVKSGAEVVATSRSDYRKEAREIGVKFEESVGDIFDKYAVDVVVISVSILSFESTVLTLAPYLSGRDILVSDVLSVKEHARNVLLKHLPPSVDIVCTHPMFGPESGRDSWKGLNLVYERTRIGGVMDYDPADGGAGADGNFPVIEEEGIDRVERFLSVFEEEGCKMVPMSCALHDSYSANSQFVTHLVGR